MRWIERCNPSLRGRGALCLLHCVAMYGDPRPEYAEIAAMGRLMEEFTDLAVGYSDHTQGTLACEVALALGARVIEKHFTDDKTREFRDHALSATLPEMRQIVLLAERITVLRGTGRKAPVAAVETQERIRSFRRGVYARCDIAAGTVLEARHLTTLRPLEGIDARRWDSVLGRRVRRDKRAHEALYDGDLE
jgi:sialic acid synthase SpsE